VTGWEDCDLADPAAASVRIAGQVDRQGRRAPLKTEESRRTIELPRQLAAMLLRHRAASPYSTGPAFVFCTRSGRALGQRNVTRALRSAMRAAVNADGHPAFPALHEGAPPVPVAVPTFHAFRHYAASQAIRYGEGAE
jgi:integrase